jgi:hypothetical protein
MTTLTHWPQLLHVKTNKVIPLRIDGETSFGRSPYFYDYRQEGDLRWTPELSQHLSHSNYIWVSDDTFLSRVHGKIVHFSDSNTLIYQDLKSTNGSKINFTPMEVTEATFNLAERHNQGHALPTAMLSHGDIITLGVEAFTVELIANPYDFLARSRCALLIDGMGPEAKESFAVTRNLLTQKRFWDSQIAVIDNSAEPFMYTYQQEKLKLSMSPEASNGFSIIYYKGRVKGETLILAGQAAEDPGSMLKFIDSIPGSKVIFIQSDEPATEFEKSFAQLGYRDTLLVTYQGFDLGASAHPAIGSLLQSVKADRQIGTFVPGDHDTLDDVLNALIDPDRPHLRIETLKPYMNTQCRMVFTLGNQLRPLDSYGGIFHSLDFDSGSSLACNLDHLSDS